MSSPIPPISGPLGPTAPTSPAVAGDVAAFMSELDASHRAFAVAAARGGPPSAVLDQMAEADAIHRRLRQSGREVRFAVEGAEHTVELRDRATSAVRAMTVSEAVELALGGSAE